MKISMVYNHLPQLTDQVRRDVGSVVRGAGFRVEREAKLSMSEPKYGRTYSRQAIQRNAGGKTGKGLIAAGGKVVGGKVTVGYKFHRASAPGEAPAIDTGNLVNSIGTRMVRSMTAEVSAGANYSGILELFKNRPFFKPAVDKVKPWFVAQMMDALRKLK